MSADSKQHSVLADVREALAAPRGDAGVDARMLALDSVQGLIEQLEAERARRSVMYAGYSAKCERWSLGTCDNVHPVVLCRICQFFTDLGYESFEVSAGGLRSWRPVPSPASVPYPARFGSSLYDKGESNQEPDPASEPN